MTECFMYRKRAVMLCSHLDAHSALVSSIQTSIVLVTCCKWLGFWRCFLITWTILEVWMITEKLTPCDNTPWTERLLGKLISSSLFQALGESSRRLLACASERAQVLELLPRSGSAGLHGATDHMQTLPNSSFTPSMYCQTDLQIDNCESVIVFDGIKCSHDKNKV